MDVVQVGLWSVVVLVVGDCLFGLVVVGSGRDGSLMCGKGDSGVDKFGVYV